MTLTAGFVHEMVVVVGAKLMVVGIKEVDVVVEVEDPCDCLVKMFLVGWEITYCGRVFTCCASEICHL
jgi:hypothetical protein